MDDEEKSPSISKTDLKNKLLTVGSSPDFRHELQTRKNSAEVIKVSNDQVVNFQEKGYQVKKVFTKTTTMMREKTQSDGFEDDVWMLLYKMGFQQMSPRNFTIPLFRNREPEILKQIDVLAYSDNEILVIECKSAEEPWTRRSIRADISEFIDIRKSVEKLGRMSYNDNVNVSVLFCLRNIEPSENDISYAEGHGIHIWKDNEMAYFTRLVDLIGNSTRHQLFASLLGDRSFAEEIPAVPAICGTLAGLKFYLFCSTPENLLKVAYVHHRFAHREGENAYQRMLDKTKIGKISEFIDGGGYFANNVIVNFTKEPTFLSQGGTPNATFGYLKLPNYYASAWVIDGQHRVYGYSNHPCKSTALIPILAFEKLSEEEQGKLFVDINKNQKAVEANLLWDLYTEIFDESVDPEKIRLCQISRIAKKLNASASSPFSDRIFIPSMNVKQEETNLTIQTICSSIKRNRLLSEELLFRVDIEKTDSFAIRKIGDFFTCVKEALADDWEKGENGFSRSNNGVSCLFILMRELVRYGNYIDKTKVDDREKWKAFVDNIIEPAFKYINSLNDAERSKLRLRASSEGERLQIAKELASSIREKFSDFAPRLMTEETSGEEIQDQDNDFVNKGEIELRTYIYKKLRGANGDNWYPKGIPQDVQKEIEIRKQKKYTKFPYRKAEIEANSRLWLDFTDIWHLGRIITWAENWPLFEAIFQNQEEIRRKIDDFQVLRNGVKHVREIDDLERRTGRVAVDWILKCIRER